VPPFAGAGPVMNLLGLAPVVAVLVGVRLHRPAARAPWRWFAAGLLLFWLGDLYTIGYPRVLGREVPFPSIGDAAYVGVYPALMAGLLLLVRRRNPETDRPGLLDALIITTGLSLVSWTGLIAPSLHAGGVGTLAKVVSVAYPIGDVLLLAAAVRLAVDGGRREPAFHLLVAAICALLVTDFAYGRVTLAGAYDNQLWLDLGWIAFYLLWGAAALHPSMARLEQPAPDHLSRLTLPRVGLLLAATLIAPVTLVLDPDVQADFDVVVIVGAAIVLFLLVVGRMAGLVRLQERAVERERVLSAAGAALVAATDRRQTYAALLDGARALVGPRATLRLEVREDGAVRTLDAAGSGSRLHRVELPLVVRAERLGVLEVAGPQRLPQEMRRSLTALATQMSLALEGAALLEEVAQRRGAARFSALIQQSSDLITVLDAGGVVVYQSPSIEGVLGRRPDEVVGRPFLELVHADESGRLLALLSEGPRSAPGETEKAECSLRHADGSLRHVEILHTDLLDDEAVQGVVLNSRDVSERRAFEEQLAHQAFHDPVTGLANRALFAERVRHAVARNLRERSGIAVVFLDLDDFKTINDSLGHAAGDRVLLEVAQRLDGCIRASDTAARLGGDEFAVLLEDIADAREAAETAERLLGALRVPLVVAERELDLRGSLGIALVPAGEAATADADELLRNADAAMYIAKRDGKATYRLFEPAMHEGVLARLELRADLQRALTANELELHYQPITCLADGRLAGFEALLRWQHPERGMVSPSDFVPFAEETGLIVPIGRWVLREGCRQAVRFNRMNPDGPLRMSINLSVKQLQHSDVVADVRDALDDAGLEPELLTLEITETVVMADTDLAVARLAELKALGVRLAMDDFGTGYSSLSYLSRFPVDVLKMDRSFLRERAHELSDLVSAVVAIGQSLHLDVVAEGIEHPEQCAALRALGCDLGQGFLFAGPMDRFGATEFVRRADATAGQP
jgi:diguanylate cyclase (GGDEF)-like protein/PAS domain S-box-containing protein